MGFLGISLVRDNDYSRLKEGAVNLGYYKRQLEDLGWQLMNDAYGAPNGVERDTIERLKSNIRGVRYYLRDPLIGAVIDLNTDYTLGGGIGQPQTDNRDLEYVFDEFWSDEDNKATLLSFASQIMFDKELQLAGNFFGVTFVNDSDGHVKLASIPADEMREIINDPNFDRRHIWYKRVNKQRQYNFQTGAWESTMEKGGQITRYYLSARFDAPDGMDSPPADQIATGRIFHLGVNKLPNGRFGHPMTLRIQSWVEAFNEFMKARVAIVQAAAMFAWNRRVKGNPNDVKKVVQAFAQKQMQHGGNIQSPGEGAVARDVQYASVLTTNDGVSWDQVKTDTGGSNAINDGRAIKGQIGAGAGFPQHYLGDIGGANLATATAMELPVQKRIERRQREIVEFLIDIHDYVIVQKIIAGELKPMAKGRFSKDAIKKKYPEADLSLVKDPLPESPTDAAGGSTALQEAKTAPEAPPQDDVKVNTTTYDYKIEPPDILQRQAGEMVNAVVNTLKAVDPYNQNIDATRWALGEALALLGEADPQAVVMRLFPPGYKVPPIPGEMAAGSDLPGHPSVNRVDRLQPPPAGSGQSRGPVDFQKQTTPPATARTGQKGNKQARPPAQAQQPK